MNEKIIEKYHSQAKDSELGKQVEYDQTYNPKRLYAIPRSDNRNEIGITAAILPFFGFDIWNHYEVSWLNEKGKPIVATAEIIYDCSSPLIIESKSLKLYFNSLNNTRFKSIAEVEAIVKKDLEAEIKSAVTVNIKQLGQNNVESIHASFSGICLDNLDVECTSYHVDPSFLTANNKQVEESVYSDLLKSNCLVTNQPDWGSVQIIYKGNEINREGLLKYIVSFRNHNEFHEQCIERIFVDIMSRCKPVELTVYGRYTRRGGLDINPFRSTKKVSLDKMNFRLVRQ